MADVNPPRKELYQVDDFSFELASHCDNKQPVATQSLLTNSPAHNDTQTICILYGPTHSRKRCLALKLQQEHPTLFRRVVPHTTRPARPLEVSGVDYHFVSREEFLELVQDKRFIEFIHIGESDTVVVSPDIDQIPVTGDLFGISADSFCHPSHTNTHCLLLTLHTNSAVRLKTQNFKALYIHLSLDKSPPSDEREIPFVSTSDADLAYNELKRILMARMKADESDVKCSESYRTAQIEWENVENNLTDTNKTKNPTKLALVNSAQALEYFRSKRMLEYINRIRLPLEPRGVRKLFVRIFGPPTMHPSLIHERNLILAMALHPFDNSDIFHTSILDSIYRHLTRSNQNCPRFGSHWEEIGFQGSDPATDLRGAGMLGLVNIFDMVTSPIACHIALDILKLSRHPVQYFPMCALSMNLTVMTLVFLRDGILTKICNRRGMVFSVVNDVYKALFYRFYLVWKEQHKTIWNSEAVLTDLERYARCNISRLLNEFYKSLEQLKARQNKLLGSAISQGDGKPVEFRGIDEIELELSLSTE